MLNLQSFGKPATVLAKNASVRNGETSCQLGLRHLIGHNMGKGAKSQPPNAASPHMHSVVECYTADACLSCMSAISHLSPVGIRVAGATIAALFTVPKKQQKPGKGQAQQQPGSATKPAAEPCTPPFPPSHYLLSVDEMQCNSYPLPVADEEGTMVCPEEFLATQLAGESACRAWTGCP